ncbi:MAG: hypothetical protein A2231_07565 [Candidatus Firestonebacteria bacterium RIFOXYA2_FULL_40_8]|nr:MAG: hypothetical protein A2231_07565 [Candidatus Firestonebacteria bacterium RIFOXYA2_FULL_40_8]
MRKTIFYMVILTAASIMFGIAVGVALDRIYFKKNFQNIVRTYLLNTSSDEIKKKWVVLSINRLDADLSLASEQKEKLEDILEELIAAIAPQKEEYKKALVSAVEKKDNEIMKILNDKQKEKYRKTMNQSKEILLKN